MTVEVIKTKSTKFKVTMYVVCCAYLVAKSSTVCATSFMQVNLAGPRCFPPYHL